MTIQEVAEAFGVSVKTIARWVRIGRFPAPVGVGAGRVKRFLADDLNTHVADLRQAQLDRAGSPADGVVQN
jgi:excisionase family DNA binding protein